MRHLKRVTAIVGERWCGQGASNSEDVFSAEEVDCEACLWAVCWFAERCDRRIKRLWGVG